MVGKLLFVAPQTAPHWIGNHFFGNYDIWIPQVRSVHRSLHSPLDHPIWVNHNITLTWNKWLRPFWDHAPYTFTIIYAGWWFQPLWKILVNWDDYSQLNGKIKNVPNHQPDYLWVSVVFRSWWTSDPGCLRLLLQAPLDGRFELGGPRDVIPHGFVVLHLEAQGQDHGDIWWPGGETWKNAMFI